MEEYLWGRFRTLLEGPLLRKQVLGGLSSQRSCLPHPRPRSF